MDDLMWGRGPVGGPFSLTDHTGQRRTEAGWPGQLKLVYFGYRFCPDVCPTDLQAIAAALDALGPLGDRVQPLFVTVDPARDTPEELARYVPSFHPRLIGLTGTDAEVRAVARAYKVYAEKTEDPRLGGYVIDHSAFIFLLDNDGKYLGFFPPGTPADRIVAVVAPHAERLRR
jgi:cytochrome oxidase Cu insertion factor (SCO1/SenC/PrrC family)